AGRRLGRPRRRALVSLALAPDAVGADAVAEVGLRVVVDVDLDLALVAVVVADLLAPGADGQEAAQHLHPREAPRRATAQREVPGGAGHQQRPQRRHHPRRAVQRPERAAVDDRDVALGAGADAEALHAVVVPRVHEADAAHAQEAAQAHL